MPPKKKYSKGKAIKPQPARKLIRLFEELGFRGSLDASSHYVMRKPGHVSNLSIPVHAGKEVQPYIIRKLVKRAGITRDEYLELLGEL